MLLLVPVCVRAEDLKQHIASRVEKYSIDSSTMLSIARAESELNPNAVNYNCFYNDSSKPCDKKDRKNAWSVDCGIFQINHKGNKCPLYLFDIDINISQAINLYFIRGFQPWKSSLRIWISRGNDIDA